MWSEEVIEKVQIWGANALPSKECKSYQGYKMQLHRFCPDKQKTKLFQQYLVLMRPSLP